MKAFIFAAGRGTRLRPITEDIPKPLVMVGGRPIIEHVFDALPSVVDTVHVVVGYKKEQIETFLGDTFGGRSVSYIHQAEPLGTGHALELCREYVGSEKFLVLYADNLYERKDLERLVEHDRAILLKFVPGIKQGVVEVDKENNIKKIIEWPTGPSSELVVTGAYLLDERVWNFTSQKRENGEYYINDMLQGVMDTCGMRAEQASFWMPVGKPEELERADEFLRENDTT